MTPFILPLLPCLLAVVGCDFRCDSGFENTVDLGPVAVPVVEHATGVAMRRFAVPAGEHGAGVGGAPCVPEDGGPPQDGRWGRISLEYAVIEVRPGELRLAGEPLLVLHEGRVAADRLRGQVLPVLLERLEGMAEAGASAAGRKCLPAGEFGGEFLLLAEGSVPFVTVWQVLNNAAQAGFRAPYLLIRDPRRDPGPPAESYHRTVGLHHTVSALRVALPRAPRSKGGLGEKRPSPPTTAPHPGSVGPPSALPPPPLPLREPGELPAPARVVGAVDREALRDALAALEPAVQACNTTGRAGVVEVKFYVAADGSITSPGIKESELDDEKVEACVVEQVAGMALPPLEEGGRAIVSQEYDLEP